MPSPLSELNGIVQEVLGGTASKALLGRISTILADGSSSSEGLSQACVRVEKIVQLFIGAEQAEIIGKRFREVLARTGSKTS